MAKIKKLQESGETIYPATITNAIKDPETGKALPEMLDNINVNAVASDGFAYSNMVYDDNGALTGATIVWPDGVIGTMAITYEDGNISYINYTKGDSVYRNILSYQNNKFSGNTITKIQ